jgi:Icc-related predicted phosphoesterase
MAAYGRGDYSGGAYSFGAYLGALAIVSASTVVVAGDKIKDAQFEISSTSTVSIDAVKISNAGVAIVDTSVMTVAGGIDAVGNVDIIATSILNIQYNRIRNCEAIIIDTSSVVINARKKWETEADVSEIWTTVSV